MVGISHNIIRGLQGQRKRMSFFQPYRYKKNRTCKVLDLILVLNSLKCMFYRALATKCIKTLLSLISRKILQFKTTPLISVPTFIPTIMKCQSCLLSCVLLINYMYKKISILFDVNILVAKCCFMVFSSRHLLFLAKFTKLYKI